MISKLYYHSINDSNISDKVDDINSNSKNQATWIYPNGNALITIICDNLNTVQVIVRKADRCLTWNLQLNNLYQNKALHPLLKFTIPNTNQKDLIQMDENIDKDNNELLFKEKNVLNENIDDTSKKEKDNQQVIEEKQHVSDITCEIAQNDDIETNVKDEVSLVPIVPTLNDQNELEKEEDKEVISESNNQQQEYQLDNSLANSKDGELKKLIHFHH